MLGIWLEIPQLESEVLHLILAPFASKNFKVCQMVGLVEEKVKKILLWRHVVTHCALHAARYICMLCQGKLWTAWGQFMYTM